MYERKRKSSSLNSGETILIKKRLTENYSTTMKWPCYQETSNQNRNENLSNIDGHHFSSCSKPNSNQKLTVIDSNTTGYFPYPDINYKPRMCRMCAAGDSGHINHILS